ncbi:MAG: Trk system potassium transporter TrkA, partial [Bacilli bacterium]|nr:Trk system potassium transporter TrkA [Bacilli bacterium]
MRIIIVGCGKVGSTIIKQLSAEGHDIVAIDVNPHIIEDITDTYDVMGVVGNCVNYQVLKEAGVEETDLLIAVTDSDEKNLLTCLIAKKAANCKTIARVRDPEISEEINYISSELGLSMVVNPEKAAASEIARLLRFPAAVQIDTFAKGDVELMKFVIPSDSPIVGLSLSEIDNKFNGYTLICCVERKDEAYIPNGSFVIEAGDKITLVSSNNITKDFFKSIGIDIKRVNNAMIVGGGKISVYLCQKLANKNIDLKIIEQDKARCEDLSEVLKNVTIINNDGSDESVLIEEGIDNVDAFVSLTGIDEENIFLSLFAEKRGVLKVITKV